MKNSEKYHGLFVESDSLLLADVFGNFRNVCLEISYVITSKKMYYRRNMSLYHSIYRYPKANSKCMKNYDKNKELLYLQS